MKRKIKNVYCKSLSVKISVQSITNQISKRHSVTSISRHPDGVGSQVRKNKIKFLPSNKISEIQHKKYLALYSSLQSDWLTRADRNEVCSKNFKMSFSISSSQLCSHTPSALNAGAKRSGATCHMAMPQCCYLAKGAKRPSHTTNMKHFFGLVQPKFIFGLLQPKFIFGLVQPKFIFGLVNSRHPDQSN